jgi:hypothetical protein
VDSRGGSGLAARRGNQWLEILEMHQQIRPEYRGSLWPILLIVFILAGAIDIATHLHHW